MFGSKSARSSLLKPYVLKTRDGFLLGLTPPSEKASPCANCVENWLRDRSVWVEKAELSQLLLRRDLIPELLTENSPHIFYEISDDGTANRLDALVFSHPKCDCNRLNYLPVPQVTKKTNFAFSPIVQLKVARFGTPDGNLWLSSATGTSPSGANLTAYGVEWDKDLARFKAVDEWMKRAVVADLPGRLDRGELIPSEVLQTGNVELITKMQFKPSSFEGVGIGANREEATLDALINLSKVRTLRRYANAMKNPMLIVGANNWVRSKVPFFLLQQYDIHLLFYPNSTPAWVVGLIAFSRHNTSEKPVFVFGAHSEVQKALEQLFFRLLEALRPSEDEMFTGGRISENTLHNPKLHMWWTHWIYRCPKISLKDVLHLEPYPKSLDHWRNYFKDGQDLVSVMNVNNEFFSSQIRAIVKLNCATSEAQNVSRNVNGIGIWRDFADALA